MVLPLIKSIDTNGLTYKVAVSGDYTYVADGTNGLLVYKTSELLNNPSPTPFGQLAVPVTTPPLTSGFTTARAIAVVGNYAYIGSQGGGLNIVDISNPAAPTLKGNFDPNDTTNGIDFTVNRVQVVGTNAYLSSETKGLVIVNVSNPLSPTQVGSYDTPGLAKTTVVAGSYAYIADDSNGLVIVNISKPNAPTLVSNTILQNGAKANSVTISGNYAYISAESGGMIVYDISNPVGPSLVSTTATQNSARFVEIVGNNAYVADGTAGLSVYDVSNPAAPVLKDSYDSPTVGLGRSITVVDNYVYIADEAAGFHVVNVIDYSNSLSTTNLANVIDAKGGNDTVTSTFTNLAGDNIIGGSGTDTLVLTGGTATNSITINPNLTNQISSANVTATVSQFDNFDLSGFAGTVTFVGTSRNDSIAGGAGVDVINSADGDDTVTTTFANLKSAETLNGGNGSDTFVLKGGATTDYIEINNGQITGFVAVSGFEKFDLSGFAGAVNFTGTNGNDSVIGGTASDDLYGDAGNDTLNGGAGADYLIGASGNDTYVVDNTGDVIVESLNSGIDTVQSSVTFTLRANVENLTLTSGANINGTGNRLANTISGNSGNNSLNGSAGNDNLTGNAGNDILIGGVGQDTLTGGTGIDRFDYNNVKDSLLATFDVITDFNAAEDVFDVKTPLTRFTNVGTVTTLNQGIAQLTTATLGANTAAQFTVGSDTFVAINDATAGFSATADAIIKVTGLTGTLNLANFV